MLDIHSYRNGTELAGCGSNSATFAAINFPFEVLIKLHGNPRYKNAKNIAVSRVLSTNAAAWSADTVVKMHATAETEFSVQEER